MRTADNESAELPTEPPVRATVAPQASRQRQWRRGRRGAFWKLLLQPVSHHVETARDGRRQRDAMALDLARDLVRMVPLDEHRGAVDEAGQEQREGLAEHVTQR